MARVLIVEDEPLLALELDPTITDVFAVTVITTISIAGAKEVLRNPVDFAFLDIDVTNGKTFEVAQLLTRDRVPFVFVSGGSADELPEELRAVRFIRKPFDRTEVQRALHLVLSGRS